RAQRLALETLGIETALPSAAAEVARAGLPAQVAAVLAVVAGARTLAGIVVESAAPGARREGAHGSGRGRAEAHGRDVEDAGRVRLRPVLAHQHAEVGRLDLHRPQRVVDPLVVLAVDVVLGAEGPLVQHVLGALVDDGALLPRERPLVGITLDEVLADLRADRFQAVAEMRRDRIVAPQG